MRRWGLYKDKGQFVIRRGKERYPISKYRRIRDDETQLMSLVLQLNAEARAREEVTFKHSLINPDLLERYREWLLLQVPNQFNARCEYNFLVKHFLQFFIDKLNLHTPQQWYDACDTRWATYLVSKEVPPSPKTKRAIIQAANRFAKWMHKRKPEFMPPLRFEPLPRAAFKKLKGNWEQDSRRRRRNLIPDAEWQRIQKAVPDIIKYRVLLAYYYGLRRREALGLKPGDVKTEHLSVERQLFRITPELQYDALKGREMRKTPHWFCTAKKAYEWLQKAASQKTLTPTEFSRLWAEHVPDYDLHDLRHTFITKAIRKHKPVDVMWAVGHKNIETTMAYLHDDRGLSDQEYRPE